MNKHEIEYSNDLLRMLGFSYKKIFSEYIMNPPVIKIPLLLLNLINDLERKPLTEQKHQTLSSLIDERKAKYDDDKIEAIKKIEEEFEERKRKFESYIKFQFERQNRLDEEVLEKLKKLNGH